MKRTALIRSTPLKRAPFPQRHPAEAVPVDFRQAKRKRRAKIPPDVRAAVLRRSRRRCVVCGRRVKLQIHHCLPVQNWPALELVADGMVGVCPGCHDNHERAHRRIRWAELPPCVIALAYATSGAAAVYLERTYPR